MAVLFCVAAGPRVGYGHLVRATVLARWLRVPCQVLIRGGAAPHTVARRLGAKVVSGPLSGVMRAGRWSGVVVDDPRSASAATVVAAARRAGLPVASVHDLSIAPVPSDLAIDGSLIAPADLPATRALIGPRYAVLDPRVLSLRAVARVPGRVVISLGGGATSKLAESLALALVAMRPDLEVVVTASFDARHRGVGRPVRAHRGHAGISRVAPSVGFRRLLASASLAITGGGVTLYEAAAMGVPTVPVAVVPAQLPTVRAFVTRGCVATTRAHDARRAHWARRVVADTIAALGDESLQRAVSRRARRVIDAQGGARVARALRTLWQSARASGGSTP